MDNGWIKIHRQLTKNWIWEDPVKLKWWLIVLMEVNFKPGKMVLGNTIIKVGIGSSAKSLRTWAALFKSGTKATTNFFDLLESDNMITRETIGKGKHSTTLINVVNYIDYQTKEETLERTKDKTLRTTKKKRERLTIEESQEKNNNNKKREKMNALDYLKKFHLKDLKEKCKDYQKIPKEEIQDFNQKFNQNMVKQKVENCKYDLIPRLQVEIKYWLGEKIDAF